MSSSHAVNSVGELEAKLPALVGMTSEAELEANVAIWRYAGAAPAVGRATTRR